MKKHRRLGRVRVSTDLILEALGFPEGTMIIACYGERAGHPGDVDFIVHHNDLPKTPEGGEAIEINPHLTITHEDAPKHWIDFSWGL